MEAVVTAITAGVTPAVVFGQIATVAPIVVGALLVGYGLTFLRRSVGGAAKGKAKI